MSIHKRDALSLSLSVYSENYRSVFALFIILVPGFETDNEKRIGDTKSYIPHVNFSSIRINKKSAGDWCSKLFKKIKQRTNIETLRTMLLFKSQIHHFNFKR